MTPPTDTGASTSRRAPVAARRRPFLALLAAVCLTATGQDLTLDLDDDPVDIDIAVPRLLFYVPGDAAAEGRTPKYLLRSVRRDYDRALQMELGDGVVGKAMLCRGVRYLRFPLRDVADPQRGTLAFWCKWTGARPGRSRRRPAIAGSDFAPLTAAVLEQADGKWHHWAATWNARARKLDLWLDGKALATHPFAEPLAARTLDLGRDCRAAIDEVYIFDQVVEEEEIAAAAARGREGKPSWPAGAELTPKELRYPATIHSANAARPKMPGDAEPDKPVAQTSTRTRYDLGGIWRAQPFGTRVELPKIGGDKDADKRKIAPSIAPRDKPWAYAKFPGSWRPHGNLGREGGLLDRSLRPLSKWDDVAVSSQPAAWLERDIQLPDLAKHSVFLIVEGVHDAVGCDFYVNDRYVGNVATWQEREYDVTAAARSGANRIAVMAGREYGATHFTDTSGDRMGLPSGPCRPVYLELRRRSAVSFRNVVPTPSFRRRSLAVEVECVNPDGKPRALAAAAVITDIGSGKQFRLAPQHLALSEAASETITLNFPWAEPILWFPDNPRLLNLSLEIADGDDVIDATSPIRFGFREVWADGGDLRMNGVPFRLRGQCHSFPSEDRAAAARSIAGLRRVGFNASVGYFLGRGSMPHAQTVAALDVADEKGFLFVLKLYGGGISKEASLAARRDYFALSRRHPAVALYTQARYGYHGPAHGSPIAMGRAVKPEERKLPEFQRDQALVDVVHRLAPGSLMGYYQQGVVGDFRSYMQYLGYGTPLQTREEWPRYWASQRPTPFVGVELDMGASLYLGLWQKGRSQTVAPVATEHAARYLGDAAYARQTVASVRAVQDYAKADAGYDIHESPNAMALMALLIRRSVRAWRTWGISFLLLDDTRIIQRPGEALNAADIAYRDAQRPVLAYIGGGDEFSRKDHAYFAGETATKRVVVINGQSTALRAAAKWRLTETGSGRELAAATIKVNLGPGEIGHFPIKLALPPVQARTELRLALEFVRGEQRQTDAFDLEVFPRPTPPAFGKSQVLLIDEPGDAAKLLGAAGVSFQKIVPGGATPERLAAVDLLVIGRGSLPADDAFASRILNAAQKGLRVLCFEQKTPRVFGLRNDDPNTRYSFIAAYDHPVLTGLKDADMRNWRGSSNFLEAYPDFRQGIKYGYLAHKKGRGFFGQNEFAQWSSNGTVATFYLEKPQVGAFSCLLSSGFDMLYTPLVELRPGRGRIVLCQLDVTNRYPVDPVATLLVHRLLVHAVEPPPPARRLAFWGDAAWRDRLPGLALNWHELPNLDKLPAADVLLLAPTAPMPPPAPPQAAAVQPPKLAAPTIKPTDALDDLLDEELLQPAAVKAGPKWSEAEQGRLAELAQRRAQISAFVERGGILVVPAIPASAAVAWLPVDIAVKRGEYTHGIASGTPELAGVASADLFYRKVLDMPLATVAGDKTEQRTNGLVTVARKGKGKVVVVQLDPNWHAAAWQRTKALRVWAAVLANLGVGMAPLKQAPDADNTPEHFMADRALDFNPDQHTSW